MKKRGFTLIELLAVIVILAIIAVITVPKISDMITSSRQGGAEDSFYGTLKAAELGYTKALQSNTNLKGSTCNIEDSKITCTNGVEINVSGKTPESGVIAVSSNGVSGANIKLNGYKCSGDLSVNNPCTKITEEYAADQLKKELTATGDGLYNDSYEPARFIYRGGSPNNYLTFNGKTAGWRIVSVESDGTLKIISDEKVADKAFDSRTSETAGRRLNSNNTYCKLWTDGIYYGCNAWNKVDGIYSNGSFSGTVKENAELNDYLNNDYYSLINANDKDKIQKHDYKTGSFQEGETNFALTLLAENKAKWNGLIGLPNVSDFIKASTNSNCTSVVASRLSPWPCATENYLYKSDYWWWALTKAVYNQHNVHVINRSMSAVFAYNTGAVRPVIFLKANIKLTGTGTKSDPYKIS